MQDKRQEDCARLRKRANRRPIRKKERCGGGGFLGIKTKSKTQRPCFWVSLKEIWSIGGGCLRNVERTFELYHNLWKSKFQLWVISGPSLIVNYLVFIETHQLPGWQKLYDMAEQKVSSHSNHSSYQSINGRRVNLINKPAATRPDASDKFMIEATSMTGTGSVQGSTGQYLVVLGQ